MKGQLLLLELELDELFDDELLELLDEELDEELEELFEDRLDELFELRLEELLFERLELELAELLFELLLELLAELLEEPFDELFDDELLELLEELFEERLEALLADPLELLFELLLDAPDRLPRSPPSRCRPTADAARFMPFSQPLKKRCTGVSPRFACCWLLRELLLEELLDEFFDEFVLLLEALKPRGPRAPSASCAALDTCRTGLGVWAWAPWPASRPATAVTMIPIRFFMELPLCMGGKKAGCPRRPCHTGVRSHASQCAGTTLCIPSLFPLLR